MQCSRTEPTCAARELLIPPESWVSSSLRGESRWRECLGLHQGLNSILASFMESVAASLPAQATLSSVLSEETLSRGRAAVCGHTSLGVSPGKVEVRCRGSPS